MGNMLKIEDGEMIQVKAAEGWKESHIFGCSGKAWSSGGWTETKMTKGTNFMKIWVEGNPGRGKGPSG